MQSIDRLVSGSRTSIPAPSDRLRIPSPPERDPPLLELSDDSFAREVFGEPRPVIVDFWAETCIPCRLQEPTMRRLGQALAGRAKVARLDVFKNPDTTLALGIKSVPHLIVFSGGAPVLELLGDHSWEQLCLHLREIGLALLE